MVTNGHPLDLAKTRVSLSPKELWAIIAAVAIAGALVAGAFLTTRGDIAEIRAILEGQQSQQQAYIDCLLAERLNKNWHCPLAPPKPAAKVAARPKPAPPSSGFQWPTISDTAKAAPKR